MANVYSVSLFQEWTNTAVDYVAYTVPSGYVAVVRSVTMMNLPASIAIGTWATVLQGCLMTIGATQQVICGIMAPKARALECYTFDLHHVLKAGQTIVVNTNDANWSVVASGYQLTLP